MGLAASQARFLAITSRKANCEFRSMEIAQDKLSVTRELAKVSENYQNALNQTSLVWDYDGSGQEMFNLSYGVLMTPSVLNNFTPYLVTNRTGAVVLNGQMANAAAAISPDGDPTTKSAAGFAKFMEYLGKSGVVSESMVADIGAITNYHYIDADGNPIVDADGNVRVNLTPEEISDLGARLNYTDYTNGYDPKAGYGSAPLNKNGACADNVYGLAYKLERAEGLVGRTISSFLANSKIYFNGAEANDSLKKNLTIEQILTNNVIAVQTYGDGEHDYKGMTGLGLLETDTDGLYLSLRDALKELLVTDAVTAEAFQMADIATRDQYMGYKELTGKKESETTVISQLKSTADEYNQIIFFKNKEGSGKPKYNSGVGVNLTHMLGYLLTQFENCLNGYDTYFAGPTYSGSSFVIEDEGYSFVMQDENAVTSEVVMKADFYMQLYNNICSNGWTMSEKIDVDEEYLEQMLKNGNFFITSLNPDGYFYQTRYNEADCVVEVKDHDAIAQAEAEFTTLKAKLTYKEDRLDIEMKNLDAEISALTTEYDSVKGLISKNVEKVFQLFQ